MIAICDEKLQHSVQCMYRVQMESLSLFVCGWSLSISYHSVLMQLVANTIAVYTQQKGVWSRGC